MKKVTVFLLFLIYFVFAQGNYYQNIDPSKNTFIQDLQNLIRSNTVVIPYDQFDETNIANFASSDAGNGQRKVTCVYSGEVYTYTPPFAWGYFSREHTFCHSWMPTYSSKSGPEYSDQHHLFPTNQNKANGVRNNHPLGEVLTVTSSFLSCKYGLNVNGKPVFEPRNEHKGDAARALLYMSLRYNGVNNKDWTFNYLNSVTLKNLGEDTQSVAILLKWHKQDPPDEWERSRNDYIYSIQKNRNPFVDHPEWVDYINWYNLSYKNINLKLANEPTNNITNLRESSILDNSVKIEWDLALPGTQSPAGYLIIMSSIPDITFPVDGKKYNQDLNFSDGNGLIYVENNVSSYVLNNLQPATDYYFSVFSYNGDADSINYKTDGQIPKIKVTTTGISIEPKFSVNDFKVSRTGNNFVTLEWKYDSLPKPTGYIISYTNSNNINFVPEDGKDYSNDYDLSDSLGIIVVTPGNINSYYVSNLNVNQRYYFTIYPFNGTTSKNYKTDNPQYCQAFTKYVNTSELLISEYVEGTGDNQYIEIYNGTGFKVELSDYSLRVYCDGANNPTYEYNFSGFMEDNTTLVIKNSKSNLYTGSAIAWENLKFDGNDAVSLYRKSQNKDIDVVGVIGQNPGTEWKYLTSWSTLDKTLRRKTTITNPVVNTNNFSTLGIEWNYANTDDVSDLGKHMITSQSNLILLEKYDGTDSMIVASKDGIWTKYVNSKVISAETGGVSTPEHSYISYDITQKLPNWSLGSEFSNEWIGWMDLNRTSVGGWGSSNYSCAMVLAANSPILNASSTQGYAIGYEYNSAGDDPLVLFKFEKGISTGTTLPTGATKILTSGYNYADADNGVNFYVKLNPDGTWTIKTKKGAKLDYASAINPASYSDSEVTSSTPDDTYEGKDFKYIGWAYAHNTAITSADFSNLGAGMYTSYTPPVTIENKTNNQTNKKYEFELYQNYPNPFNPVTNIAYSLKVDTNVKLKVFNSIGQEVKVLVNGYQTNGKYTVQFDASSLPSGIYYYMLETTYGSFTKKMLLIK